MIEPKLPWDLPQMECPHQREQLKAKLSRWLQRVLPETPRSCGCGREGKHYACCPVGSGIMQRYWEAAARGDTAETAIQWGKLAVHLNLVN